MAYHKNTVTLFEMIYVDVCIFVSADSWISWIFVQIANKKE